MSGVTLRASLDYEPRELKFGTSGRRGEVVHLTQLEIYINALAELEYLQSLDAARGGIVRGQECYFARDLRPSSDTFVPDQGGRGEIAQAIVRAIADAGMKPVNLGRIPTPAVMAYAVPRHCGSIMVTGSHIPFDRNGYKTNTAHGELLKEHEGPINQAVARVRERLYSQPFEESLFDAHGRLKTGSTALQPEDGSARAAYIARYTSFFAGASLAGLRLLVYQHSAVGRDLLAEVLRQLGATVIPAGRSDTFVPIDTENIDDEQLAAIQRLLDGAGPVDAVVSTDGDSDRPLLLGTEHGRARFFGGDLVGMVVAAYLGADAVVVPISCNDGIDRGPLAAVVEPKTRIGSPFVIAGMDRARAAGKRAICGWEANGGFLTGSDIVRNGLKLPALPTRDALLPILATLFAAREKGVEIGALFDALPKRYSRAALLKQFPRPVALQIVERFSAPAAAARALAPYFPARDGFSAIDRLDYTDGVRIIFANGDVAHLRPSGNADEFRIYAVASTQARADEIARLGVAEPDGILRRLEKAVAA
jgi:phosphomannomutase